MAFRSSDRLHVGSWGPLTPGAPRLASLVPSPHYARSAQGQAEVRAGPGGLVVEIAAAALVTAIGSLFAAGDAALTEIPEGRMQALSADTGSRGAPSAASRATPFASSRAGSSGASSR